MLPIILDGRKLAAKFDKKIEKKVLDLKSRAILPCLGIVLKEGDLASEIFVRQKQKKAEALGIKIIVKKYSVDVFRKEAEKQIGEWNLDSSVHGIVVQIPKGNVDELHELIRMVDPEKDVDCLHPENIGLLSLSNPRFLPPTPNGIHQLLLANKIKIEGKHVVIVGRGNLVGKPLALTLLQKNKNANATITVCHSRTVNLKKYTQFADILVVAIGRREFFGKEYVRRGCVLIDVGIHKVGSQWFGDVKHFEVDKIVSAVAPVPGGVGPMTVSMLLQNVVQAAEKSK